MTEINEKNIQSFLDHTKDVIYLRKIDKLLIIRPNKIHHLNDSAFEILFELYSNKGSPDDIAGKLSRKYNVSKRSITNDIIALLKNINYIMNENYSGADLIETVPFDPDNIAYPVLSEIALTYRCQNRCDFCYASSPYRGNEKAEMTCSEVKTVIDKIHGEASVPTISFTGGEPTLRDDLLEIIEYASLKGMRTNLITNGIKCSDRSFVKKLADSGLNSAQVSLESHDEEIHNSITGNCNSYGRVIKGIENLKESGIYTHTNTTICAKNRDSLIPLVEFVDKKFQFPYLSMNMIIKTGIANDNENREVNYSTIEEILSPLIKFCEIRGIKFVWYSPTPYCIFNPVDHNLGSKSCACVSGLLSVDPAGDILPCSSYERGLGNLLKNSFHHIWNSDEALYFREKRFLPPVCKECRYKKLCSGACPLYWENAGSFREIEEVNNVKPIFKNLLWQIENRLRVKTRGTRGLNS